MWKNSDHGPGNLFSYVQVNIPNSRLSIWLSNLYES
ncbi:MAG: hypothetical protein NBKEAIPA_01241 [Nitrospirae bacterium]|nr:MAG: hypothetical protein UZ03_NOB001001614 [Nitrospira sp. OLB3]MBV6469350.1 hypothetical protein [Nitrospirota bacterium]